MNQRNRENRLLVAIILFIIVGLFGRQNFSAAQVPFDLKGHLFALKRSKPDTNRILLLHDIGKFYVFKSGDFKDDIDSAIYFFQEALRVSDTLSTPNLVRRFRNESLCRLGETYFQQGDTAKANECFRRVIIDYQKVGDVGREARTWLRYGRKIMLDNQPEVIAYFETSLRLYRKIKDKGHEVEALYSIAKVHLNQGKLDLAEEELLRAQHICDSVGFNNDRHVFVNYLFGEQKRYKGDFEGAIACTLKAIRTREALGSKSSFSLEQLYHSLASLYKELGQTDKSIEWYRKSIDGLKKLPIEELATFRMYQDAGSLSEELIKQGRATDALTSLLDLIREKAPGTDIERGSAAQALGLCYAALHNDDLAEKEYRAMIGHYSRGNYFGLDTRKEEIMAQANYDICKFYIDRKRYDKAAAYLPRIANVTPGIFTLTQQRDRHLMMYMADSAAGNYLAAMQHFRAQNILNDSIFNIAKSKQIAELQIQYETEKKEQDLKLLQTETDFQKGRLKLTIGSIVLLIITLAFLYGRYLMKQKSNRKLQLQQEEINRKNESLENMVLEKEWLLKEIHHRVKNNLQMVTSLLETQSDYLQNEAARAAIRASKHRMQAISLLHQKLYKSENVSEINAAVYVAELTEYLRDSFDTEHRIRFNLDVQPIMVDISLAIPVGLILNEAITNSIKYAFPIKADGVITIALAKNATGHLVLTIADNGIGLPDGFDVAAQHSLGMNLITTLCEQMEGVLDIQGRGGTRIQITMAMSGVLV